MAIVLPPNHIFESAPNTFEKVAGGEIRNSFTGLTKDEKGRILAESSGSILPRRGLVYPSAAKNNRILKNIIVFVLNSLMTFRPTVKWIDKVLGNFHRLAIRVYLSEVPVDGISCETCKQSLEGKMVRSDYMQFEYYNPQSQGIWLFFSKFFTELGCSIINSDNIGKDAATVFEYEEPYRWRLGDIFGEINKKDLIKNPRKEVNRILYLYIKREKMNGDEKAVNQKFIKAFKFLSYLLFIPKIKQAFIYTVKNTDFTELKLDKYDIYHALLYPTYDFFGANIETRKNWFVEFCQSHGVKVIFQ